MSDSDAAPSTASTSASSDTSTNNPTNPINLFARTKSSINNTIQNAKTTIQSSNETIKTKTSNAGKNISIPKVNLQVPNQLRVNNIGNKVGNLGNSIGNMFPPRYALPDKTVASQVLMYRQLLHTECKPGLRLSRAFQGTDAQRAVMHMPWWEAGVETTKRMVISYDNLIVRLWLNGAIMPYVEGGYAEEHKLNTAPKDEEEEEDLLNMDQVATEDTKPPPPLPSTTSTKLDEVGDDGKHIDTLIDEKGLPPTPHRYWIDRLGFQQNDPVTDFRSGGVLSLAMLVHIVEACPDVHARFLPSGDAHMLPFGITCINVTDMIAKFCMFAKSICQGCFH